MTVLVRSTSASDEPLKEHRQQLCTGRSKLTAIPVIYEFQSHTPPSQPSESESGYISSSHIRLIRCLAVIGQASFTREHLV